MIGEWGEDVDEDDPPSLDSTTLEYVDLDLTSNSASHQREGQNVLFNDGHVNFERHPNVGIQNDNIWTYWSNRPPLNEEERQGIGDWTSLFKP